MYNKINNTETDHYTTVTLNMYEVTEQKSDMHAFMHL